MKWNSSGTTKLRVAYAKLSPFVDVTETNKGDILGGFMPQILRKVANWMNLELTFIREPMDEYGDWGNNTWSGMIGMLFRNEVDLILNPILPQGEFLEFLYYTNPITIEAFTILAGKETQDAEMFLFFSVLDKSVWIGIMISLLLIAVSLSALFRNAILKSPFQWINKTGKYCWNLFSYMLRQAPRDKFLLRNKNHASSVFLQVLIMIWAFCIAFIVMNTFQSLMVTKLTLKKAKPVVDTLADLVESKRVVCLAPREIQLDHVLKDSNLPVNKRAYEKIRNDIPQVKVFQPEILRGVERGVYCIIHGHLILEDRLSHHFQKLGKCNMHLSVKYFYPFSLLMAIHRKAPVSFYETFNLGITRLVDADITGKWFESALHISNLCTSYNDGTVKPLGLEHIYGVLVLWAAGLAVAMYVYFRHVTSLKITSNATFPQACDVTKNKAQLAKQLQMVEKFAYEKIIKTKENGTISSLSGVTKSPS